MANYQVTPSGNPKFEPSVAVHLLSPNIIISTSVNFTTGSPLAGLYRSVDGGVNWTNTLLPPPAGFTGAEAPFVAYGFPNLFIIIAHAFPANGLSGAVIVYRSTDSGVTFSPPVIVDTGYGTFINNDATIISIDASQKSPYLGNVYLGYARQTNIDFSGRTLAFFQRSVDEGLTWERPLLLSNVEQSTTERPSIAVDLFGNVYAGWINFFPPIEYELLHPQVDRWRSLLRADNRAFTSCGRSQPASGSRLRISLLDLSEPCGRHVSEPANEQHAIRGMAGLPSWICRYLFVQVTRSGNNVELADQGDR